MAPYWQNDFSSRSLDNVSVPAKLKCWGPCQKLKPEAAFSKKQMNSLKLQVKAKSLQTALSTCSIKCIECTPSQVVEMFCKGHNKMMGLDDFSKTHRKDPDNAYCKKCMNKRTTIQTTGEIARDSKTNNDDDDEEDDDGATETNSVTDDSRSIDSGVRNLSLNGTSTSRDSTSMNTTNGQSGGVTMGRPATSSAKWDASNNFSSSSSIYGSSNAASSPYGRPSGTRTADIDGSQIPGRNNQPGIGPSGDSREDQAMDLNAFLSLGRHIGQGTGPFSSNGGVSHSPSSSSSISVQGSGSSLQSDQFRGTSGFPRPSYGAGGPVLRAPPSVANNVKSSATETGSRARFPKVRSETKKPEVVESDSSDDDDRKTLTSFQSAPHDSDEDENEDENFFG
ncbi:hypothetical protein NA57DRAFT_77992 [Rhizodiscina lignyota]|uniref:Stc1 domain-containing protein n=1 Tax=Rhizodiscina lignyota TaxID=1504668 RepID=A0A9P4M360_9PEZI|nr:hypothetical protein NA57DRAFT_77992 [Rhizodiscina lignyota]